MAYFTVHGWLALTVTNSIFWVGVTAAMNGVALMLFSLIGGVLADRLNRKTVVMVGQLTQMVLSLTVAILIFTDRIELWHVLSIAFLRGSAGALKLPSRMALVLDVVERKDLLQATAANFIGMTVMGIIIPIIAGVIVHSFDIAWAYVMMGMTSLLAPLTMLGLRGLESPKKQKGSPVRDFKDGVGYVFTNPMIRTLLLIGIIAAIFGWGSEAMYPVMARDVLHAGPIGVGLLFAAANAGGLLAALVMSSIGDIRNKGRMLLLGYLGFGFFLILFALSPWLLVSLLLIGLAGLSSAVAETSMDTLVQSSVPDEMRGRVLSVQAFSYGASGSAGIYTGSVAALVGAPLAIAIGGGVVVLHALRLVRGLSRRFVKPHTGSITSG